MFVSHENHTRYTLSSYAPTITLSYVMVNVVLSDTACNSQKKKNWNAALKEAHRVIALVVHLSVTWKGLTTALTVRGGNTNKETTKVGDRRS